MTVWDLIVLLQKMPMDAKVYSDGAIAETELTTGPLSPEDVVLVEYRVYVGLGSGDFRQ